MNFSQILEADARLTARIRIAEKPGPLRITAAFLAHSGDSWFWAAGLVLLWWLGNSFWKQWASIIFGGIAALAALVMIVKFSVKRRRPEGEWGLLYRSTDPHSFPSGHAARAFLIGVMALYLGPNWLAVILILWAPLVALARVAMGVHYVSDIAAGALLGVLAGMLGYQIYPYVYANFLAQTNFPLW